jgi:ribosomal protein L37AE/L43A
MMEQNTVSLRVQVIDMEAKILDLRLPTFLKSSDLSQRIAREAGLQAYWPDRTRKLYALRARGRLLQPNETLQDLRVIDNELLYILPQIRPGSPLQEQQPEYPGESSYAAGALSILLILVIAIMFFSINWGLSLSEEGEWTTLIFPAMAVGVLCTSFSRHAWGGSAMQPKVIGSAILLYMMALLPCFLVSFLIPTEDGFVRRMIPGMISGIVGILISWLAWWGAVERLIRKKKEVTEEEEQQTQHTCVICGGAISTNVLTNCVHQCGRTFHKGCYTASATAYRGPEGFCHVCKVKLR